MRMLVRHAVVQYSSKNAAGQATFETAFRGMVVDLPEGPELDRLKQFGAVVAEDDHLTRPGRMLTLPETAGDAEIVSWVAGATPEEVEMLVRERPVMAPRILAAQESVTERFAQQNEHLGGLQAIADEATAAESAVLNPSTDNSGGLTPAPQPSTTAHPAVNDPGDVPNPAEAGQQTLVDQGEAGLDDEEADDIVGGTVQEVKDYVSENPEDAQAILSAENRREEGPRAGVVKAVQAAAAFTARG